MLWLTSYIFLDFVLFYFCGDNRLIPYKSLPPSVSRPMRRVLKWQTHGSPCPSFCLFSPSVAAAAAKSLQLCPTVCDPIDSSPRLLCPWDSPCKSTGVGCHFLLQCMKEKSESEDAQSCLTLSDPMDCSPPGSSIPGILQARVLEWGAIAFSASSASAYCTMLMSASTTVYELIERRLYITASFHQTELVYLYVLCCAKLLHLRPTLCNGP